MEINKYPTYYNHTTREEIKNRWCSCTLDMTKYKFVPPPHIHTYLLHNLLEKRENNMDVSFHSLHGSSARGPRHIIDDSL